MKNKLLKPILLTLLASSLVACDSNEAADTSKENQENQIVEEVKEDNASDENKPASDNIDKDKLEDTKENKEELEKDTIEVEKKESEDKKEDSNKDKEKEKEPSQESSTEEDKNLHDKDGKYVTTLMAKLQGEPDEYLETSAYASNIEDDKLIVSGSFDLYANPENYDEVEHFENLEDHKFVINDQTEFQAVGGTAPAEKFTREEFLDYIEKVKDSGLALIIMVENGVVTTVSISS